MWQHLNWGRILFITLLAPVVGWWLLSPAAGHIAMDLPPYDPVPPLQSLCATLAMVILWPAAFAANVLGQGSQAILLCPFLLLSGFFWAVVVEVSAGQRPRVLANKRATAAASARSVAG